MKSIERELAIKLRQEGGLSVGDISKKLLVAKSSVSRWVRGIILSDYQKQRLENNSVFSRTELLKSLAAGHRARRTAWVQTGKEMAALDDKFRLICGMYWGEGNKASPNTFSISNSDPDFLKLVFSWLIDNGYQEKIIFKVHYHPENPISEEEILRFWQGKLPLMEERNIRKFIKYKKRKTIAKKFNILLYGTGVVEVNLTELKQKVLGGIEYLRG